MLWRVVRGCRGRDTPRHRSLEEGKGMLPRGPSPQNFAHKSPATLFRVPTTLQPSPHGDHLGQPAKIYVVFWMRRSPLWDMLPLSRELGWGVKVLPGWVRSQ